MDSSFRPLGEEIVHQGAIISVVRGRFAAPDGTEFERDIVRHPGAVSVVPLHDDGSVTLVRQYRSALDEFLLEIPAGKRDVPGEAPELTARRELAEEVGLAAHRFDLLAEFVNSAGFCDERSWVFLARDLHEVERDRHGVEEQHLEEVSVPLGEVPTLIAERRLVDAKSIIGLLAALRMVESEGRSGS